MNKWVTAALSLWAANSWAAGPLHGVPIPQDTSLERYASDLVGEDSHKRLFAARVLRTRVREAWRVAGRNTDDFRNTEALQTLSDFDTLIAPRCIRQLKVQNTLRPCAKILGMLETETALPALRSAMQETKVRRSQRVIGVAIKRIEYAQ